MDWSYGFFDPRKLKLDSDNPRIEIASGDAQADIRSKLIRTERVIDLAKEIVDADGLLMGERIIVTKENSKHVVLEGNRRVCACQMLLDPRLVPVEYRARFPKLNQDSDADLIERLSNIPADIAPTREAAEITITRRHTKRGILPWLPIAQHRRIQRLMEKGKSIDEVAAIFGVAPKELSRLLRESELMHAVVEQKGWTEYEKETLRSPRLKTNPFTRFFTLRGAKETLGISFDDSGRLDTSLQKRLFNKALKEVARALLIPDPDTNKPRFNTRASPIDVFESAFSSDDDLRGLLADARRVSTRNKKKAEKRKSVTRPKNPNFFEGISCDTGNTILDGVADELRRINYTAFPRAASILARATLESALNWAIALADRDKVLRAESKSKDPGLQAIIRSRIQLASATVGLIPKNT
jgi:hypothetical protein